eukprot:532538-Pelagomonas_calceolata.AAC.1
MGARKSKTNLANLPPAHARNKNKEVKAQHSKEKKKEKSYLGREDSPYINFLQQSKPNLLLATADLALSNLERQGFKKPDTSNTSVGVLIHRESA